MPVRKQDPASTDIGQAPQRERPMDNAMFWTMLMIAGAMFGIASGINYITSLM